ncbi:hypothetical protein NBRC116493_10440 [Aurantivibrio infirmus]
MNMKEQMLPQAKKVTLPNGMDLSYVCWNPDAVDKPSLLLLHGTSFVAATFNPIAEQLVSHFQVFAYDRRGHGLSSKPEQGYEFMDFAEDCIGFCKALGLKDTYAVGHSAGGTDMLIAQSIENTLFKKIFVMEPTLSAANDVSIDVSIDVSMEEKKRLHDTVKDSIRARARAFTNRRSVFSDREELFANYKEKPVFKTWDEAILKAYIDVGFKDRDDGQVELQCSPEIETQILETILFAFQDAYLGDHRGDPFQSLSTISCPLLISSAECSEPIYQAIVPKATAIFPNAKRLVFPGLNHCSPQESPDTVAKATLDFWLNS